MRMDLVLIALGFPRVAETERSSSGGSDAFFSHDFSTGFLQDWPAERIGRVKRKKNEDGPVMPELERAADLNWVFGVSCKTVSEVELDYWWYPFVTVCDVSPPGDILADVVDDFDDIFPQKALWEGNRGSSFMTSNRWFITTALAAPSKAAPTSA